MKWAEIAQLFLGAVKETPSSATELWLHINEGMRAVCSRVDVRELETTDETITTTATVDYSALPENVFSVIQVDNVSNGVRVQPEPSGMRGRSQFLDSDSGSPAAGSPIFYDVTGNRIYWRPTPDDAYQIRIRYKLAPEAVDESDSADSPILPEHLHRAIAMAAACNYLAFHPEADEELQSLGATRKLLAQQELDKMLSDPQSPKGNERFDQSGRMYLRGFSRFQRGR